MRNGDFPGSELERIKPGGTVEANREVFRGQD